MTASFLEWTDKHRIGIAMLDFEHQDLFRKLDELLQDLLRHDSREIIEDCLGEIHARMEAHFALEERFMREKKYVHYADHKAEHDQLLDDFGEFMARVENDPEFEFTETEQKALLRWVEDHVLTSDKKMSALATTA